jgi:hypothetical protein
MWLGEHYGKAMRMAVIVVLSAVTVLFAVAAYQASAAYAAEKRRVVEEYEQLGLPAPHFEPIWVDYPLYEVVGALLAAAWGVLCVKTVGRGASVVAASAVMSVFLFFFFLSILPLLNASA